MRSRCICIAVASALTICLYSSSVRADLEDPTHNGIKGTVGLGLLGADVTLMIEGAARVRNPWLLSLIPIAVAGGGAAGGWFVGQESAPASVALLVSGLALIIPAAILVAHGRSYRVSRDDEGFVDRTEEGRPYESGTQTEVIPDGETQTEVVGPEEGEEPPAPDPVEPAPEAPFPEEEDGESGPSAQGPSYFARMSLNHSIPVGGMLRVITEESQRHGLQLSLTYF